MKFTKEDARRRVLNCAKQYQQKLLNKKLIIIYRERQDNAIRYIEVVFHERNYQHLTGLELVDEEGNVLRNQSMNFYRKCIENKLGLEEFRFKQDGTTQLKLPKPVMVHLSAFLYLQVKQMKEHIHYLPYSNQDKNLHLPLPYQQKGMGEHYYSHQ